jgi:hypothetical protein
MELLDLLASDGQPRFACYQHDGERFRLGAVNVLSLPMNPAPRVSLIG